jgi:hypothetical protein
MNFVDWIVSIVLLAPLIYVALWYYRRSRLTGGVADQIVQNLSEKSRMEAKIDQRSDRQP